MTLIPLQPKLSEKFKLINPETIGQSQSYFGEQNPADISILMVYLEGKIVVFPQKSRKESIERKQLRKTGLFYDLFFIWCEDHWDDDRFTFCIFIEEGANSVDNGTIDRLYLASLFFSCDTNCIEKDTLTLTNESPDSLCRQNPLA